MVHRDLDRAGHLAGRQLIRRGPAIERAAIGLVEGRRIEGLREAGGGTDELVAVLDHRGTHERDRASGPDDLDGDLARALGRSAQVLEVQGAQLAPG